jgi:hypothetical protein
MTRLLSLVSKIPDTLIEMWLNLVGNYNSMAKSSLESLILSISHRIG